MRSMAEVRRSARVGERLREELAELLLRQVHDPRVAGSIVSNVDMTADLQLARVKVRLADGGDIEAKRKALLAGLESASGMLRRELGKRLALRYAPRLTFHYDDGIDRRSRIDGILDEISRAPRAKSDDEKP